MPAAVPNKTGEPAESASRKTPSRRRRLFFLAFKWLRISLLLLVFVVIILGLFLNHVGLPGWVEERLQRRIEAHGWKAQFSRLRLRWYHGIVAEDLILHRTNTLSGPNLFLRSAELRPNWRALSRLNFDFEGVALKDGRLIWPLPGTNQPSRTLALNQVGGELIFRDGDTWELKFLESDWLNTHFRFRGEITNASVLRTWTIPHGRGPSTPSDFWRRLISDLEKIKFDRAASAQAIFHGDARDWRAFSALIRVNASGLDSPWGSGTNVTAVARTLPLQGSNQPMRLALAIGADDAHTPWAQASRVALRMEVEPALDHYLPTNAVLSGELRDVRTDWVQARQLTIEARGEPIGHEPTQRQTRIDVTGDNVDTPWATSGHLSARIMGVHGPTNYLPAHLETTFIGDELASRWVTSQWAHIEFQADLPARPELGLFRTNQPWIDRITNLPFHVTASVSNAIAMGYVVDRTKTTVDWQYPVARVTTDLSAGEAAIVGEFVANAMNREVRFTNSASLRPAAFARFLSTNAQRWLAHFDSLQTPALEASGRFILTTLDDWPTNWQADVFPTLELRGRLDTPSASFGGIELVQATFPFSLTNRVWQFTNLKMVRPEGELRLHARADETTGQFSADIVSSVNPLHLQTVITNASRAFSYFVLNGAPPLVEAQLSGNWHDWSNLHATANVRLTNFVFRGVPIDSATAQFVYTNQWLSILNPIVLRPVGERAIADGIAIDFSEPRLYLTNAIGRVTPLAIGQMIGPITRRTIEPYVFEKPPDARVEGSIPLGRKNQGTEYMRFELDGGRFDWNVLHFDRLKGDVIWQGDNLTLTNMSGLWRGGTMHGWSFFDFAAPRGGRMSFDAAFAANSLKAIVTDFQRGRTNRLEGTLNGRLRVTQADINNLQSWNGYGFLNLDEGLIWDIPLFGLLSPFLNAMVPGLGNSRAKEGRATFTLTNSVVYSEDLEIVANATRLRYQGKVDFDGNVTARVEARLMRELPLGVGRLVSTVFRPVTELLKYSVSGTLDKPKLEPVNLFSRVLTKVVALPFMPLKAVNEILTQEKKEKEKEQERKQSDPVPPKL